MLLFPLVAHVLLSKYNRRINYRRRSKVDGTNRVWVKQNTTAHETYLLFHSYLEEVGKTAEPETSLWLTTCRAFFNTFSHVNLWIRGAHGGSVTITSSSRFRADKEHHALQCCTPSPSIKTNSPQLMFPCVSSKYTTKVTVVMWRRYFPTNTEVLIKPHT